jgi:hypothetical protein
VRRFWLGFCLIFLGFAESKGDSFFLSSRVVCSLIGTGPLWSSPHNRPGIFLVSEFDVRRFC